MLKILFLILFVGCFALARPSQAADMKIGVFNAQAVAMQSEAAKASRQKMEAQFGKERNQIEKEAKDLREKAQDLQSKAATLSAKAREEKQMEFLKQRQAFEEKSRSFARKVEAADGTIRQGMAQYIFQASNTVAKQKNLDLILDGASGAIMYAKPDMDVTKAVLDELNKIWKANGNKFPTAPSGNKR